MVLSRSVVAPVALRHGFAVWAPGAGRSLTDADMIRHGRMMSQAIEKYDKSCGNAATGGGRR
jgi:hypothetical protein